MAAYQAAGPSSAERDRGSGARGAAHGRLRPLLPRARRRPGVPGNRIRGSASELEREAAAVGAEALHRRLRRDRPARGRQDRAGQRPAHGAGARGRRRSRAAPSATSRPRGASIRTGRVRVAGIEQPRELLAERIELRVRAMLERGLARRGGGPGRRVGSGRGSPPPRPSATLSWPSTWTERSRWRMPSIGPCAARGTWPDARWPGSVATRGSAGSPWVRRGAIEALDAHPTPT